jgi:DNA-binding GntR family transcriptional regulator
MPEAQTLPVTVTQRVVEAIETMVADGRLEPGGHVSEPFLATSLGVSRGPVREACRALVERGLLTAHANRGCFVREISVQEVADLYDVRAALARLAGRTLAARITSEQQAELADISERHETASDAWDILAMQALNIAFHSRIIAFTGNQRLQAIEAGMDKELAIYRGRTGIIPSRNAEHKAIIDALLQRDPEGAGAAMELHMLNSKTRFLQTLSPG